MVATALWVRGCQLVRHPATVTPGSDRGSRWTSRKSAGPLGQDTGAGLAQQPPPVTAASRRRSRSVPAQSSTPPHGPASDRRLGRLPPLGQPGPALGRGQGGPAGWSPRSCSRTPARPGSPPGPSPAAAMTRARPGSSRNPCSRHRPGGGGPGAGQPRAGGGHRGPGGHGRPRPAGGPGRRCKGGAVAVGAVQGQLGQVGAGLELAEGGGQEPVPVVDLDRQPRREATGPGQPAAGHPDTGGAGATLAQRSCGSYSGTSPCHPVGPGGFDWTLGEHNLEERRGTQGMP